MSELKLTIAACPTSGLSIEKEVQLIKVGLLYADKITLCSLASSMIISISGLTTLDEKGRVDFIEQVLPYTTKDPSNLSNESDFIYRYRELLKKKRLSREELITKMKINNILDNIWKQMEDTLDKISKEYGFNRLIPAIESGNLDIAIFGTQSTGDTYMDDVVKEFVDIVGREVINGKTYPLFDEDTGKLISAGIKEGFFKYSDSNSEKSRHIGFVSDIIQRLPTFEEASIDEVLDIRIELEKPLIRFRSAMLKYSEEIKHEVWEEEFINDAEKIFLREIEPAILDIEEAVKTNKYLSHLVTDLLNKPMVIPSTSGLGVLISSLSNFPKFSAAALGLIAGTGLIAYNAYREWEEKSDQLKRAQLYFYYKIGKLLNK